jgi:SAM-dependent methyltransferase|tara:strand:- start:43 stop:612 length:570 start_codon:yes stop_codon:yes gene_type:complete
MTFLAYILLFIILGLFVIALPLFLILVIESLIRGHDLPTSRRATRALADTIRKYKLDVKNFYDLGCAHGALSLRMKKFLPRLKICAIDNSAVRIFFAKLKSKILRRKVNFQKQDIFKADLRNADVVYTYLWYDLMPILEKKLQQELKQGAVVITNTSHFQNWQPTEKVITYPKVSSTPDFETLFVYIKD